MKRTWLILFVILLIAFLLRVLPRLDAPAYQDVDCYQQARFLELLLGNATMPEHDPLRLYGDSGYINNYPVFGVVAAILVRLTRLDFNWFTYLFPAFLGTLVLIPAYFLAKAVFQSRTVGEISAALLAVLPTQFLGKSMLGYFDYHVWEVLLTTTFLLFAVLFTQQRKFWQLMVAAAVFILYAQSWQGWAIAFGIVALWAVSTPYRVNWFANERMAGARYSILLIASLGMVVASFSDKLAAVTLFILPGNGSVEEMQPSMWTDWVFGYGLGLAFLAFGYFKAFTGKVNTLFLFWASCWTIAAVFVVRWQYYASIPLAMLTAYGIVQAFRLLDKYRLPADKWMMPVAAVLTTFAIAGTIYPGIHSMTRNRPAISYDWQHALLWLRDNTPLPTQDGKALYGVLAWEDYGYTITYIANRAPMAVADGIGKPDIRAFFKGDNQQVTEGARYVVLEPARIESGSGAWLMYCGGYPDYKQVYFNETVSIFERKEV